MGLITKTIFLSRSSRGRHTPLGTPILAPETVENYDDICEVISQVRPLEKALLHGKRFGFAAQTNLENKALALAYFLGVMVGDMSKHAFQRKGYSTMSVRLQLSKRHQSNLRFGEFVTYCAGLLGLRMRRINDYVRPPSSPYDAYRWVSQSSQLLMWLFETCLGLGIDEKTTNDPVRADWLKEAPSEFQRSFLQGLADSDGYVDLDKHEIGIIVDPNESLIGEIMYRLKVRFRPAIVKTQTAVILSAKEAHTLSIFSPIVRTHKFELTRKLAEARRFQGPWPHWLRHEITNS